MADVHNNAMAAATAAVEPTPATTTMADPAPVSAAPASDSIQAAPTESQPPIATGAAVPAPVKEETTTDGQAVVEATPVTEGVLGYKAPGFVKSLRFSKKFFWFSHEALKPGAVTSYLHNEKSDLAHHHAAWAKETGSGLLFFAKRAEDQSSPAGILNLADIDHVVKEGFNEFSFRLNGHKHTFEAPGDEACASWIVAIETKAAEAKSMEESIMGRESYKNHLASFVKPAAAAAPLAATTHKESSVPPRRSLETRAKHALKKDSSGSSSDEEKKEKKALKKQEKEEKAKSRSQSRKRVSIFGSLMGKKEEHDENKADKDTVKGEKKIEETHRIDNAKPTHESTTADEVGAASATATAPVAAVATEHKHAEDKGESNPAITTDKKAKRGSIFGSLFAKKDGVVSPSVEKTEKDVGPSGAVRDSSMPRVSESAPKIDEPILNKPIDTAAVTAPVGTSTATSVEGPSEATASAPFHHQATTAAGKGGFMGFIKKPEPKVDSRREPEEKNVEDTSTLATETPVVAGEAAGATTAGEGRPNVREKRRTSLFGNLGTRKEKNAEANVEAESPDGETKKSSLPQSSGGIFRKLSKAVRPAQEKKNITNAGTDSTPIPETREPVDAKPEPITKDEPALMNGTSSHPPNDTVGGAVPEAIITPTPEVKATA